MVLFVLEMTPFMGCHLGLCCMQSAPHECQDHKNTFYCSRGCASRHVLTVALISFMCVGVCDGAVLSPGCVCEWQLIYIELMGVGVATCSLIRSMKTKVQIQTKTWKRNTSINSNNNNNGTRLAIKFNVYVNTYNTHDQVVLQHWLWPFKVVLTSMSLPLPLPLPLSLLHWFLYQFSH